MKRALGLAVAVIGSVLLLVLLVTRILAAKRAQAAAAQAAPVPLPTVGVVEVTRQDVVSRVTFTATVHANDDVQVFAKVPGRAQRVLVQVGDSVKVGQTLAVIEHDTLALQQSQADAQVQVAAAAVDQAQLGVTTQQSTYDRAKTLHDKAAMSDAEFDQVQGAYQNAQAAVKTAQAQLAVAHASDDLAMQALANSAVASPIGGTVTARTVEPGAQVSPAQSLFEVQDLSQLKVTGSVEAGDFGRLAKGQAATITVDALPGQTFAGQVSTLSPSLDPATRRAAIEVAIDNSGGKLLPNMFAQVSVELGHIPDALTIPGAALLAISDGNDVYRVRDGVAQILHPTLAATDGSELRVLSNDLAPGDLVIVSGQAGLADQSRVTTQPVDPGSDAPGSAPTAAGVATQAPASAP
jgi:HlyD family secretion protein